MHVADQDIAYCIECGARLEPDHRFCWSCGTERWTPGPGDGRVAAPAETDRPPHERLPPVPAEAPRALGQASGAAAGLGVLPWLYAAGAIVFLVEATQGLATLAAPGGRAQLAAELAREGYDPTIQGQVLIAYWVLQIGGSLVAAALHGAAFYGLRRLRRWGWIVAVVVAALWSLLIVGLPVLIRLVNRDVRRSFGVD